MSLTPAFRYPGGANQSGAKSMDDDLKRKLEEVFAQLTALQLVVNEALSLALYHEPDPDQAVTSARKDIDQMIATTEKMAISGPNAEFRKRHIERIRSLVKPLLDSIEKRVSQLKQERTIH
jgi:hypothetical protein